MKWVCSLMASIFAVLQNFTVLHYLNMFVFDVRLALMVMRIVEVSQSEGLRWESNMLDPIL